MLYRSLILLPLVAAALVGCKPENKFQPPPPPEISVAKPLQRQVQPFEVLTPGGHRRHGITAHRVTTLAPRDVTRYAGIPVTSIARTVFDTAHRELRVSRLLNEARNRAGLVNVAVSRAQCLAFVVASPRLLESRARTVDQMRLINALCRFVELAGNG